MTLLLPSAILTRALMTLQREALNPIPEIQEGMLTDSLLLIVIPHEHGVEGRIFRKHNKRISKQPLLTITFP